MDIITQDAAAATTPSPAPQRRLIILGIRGVPAAHGGFETFAERLSLWLHDHGWDVTVYCQDSPTGRREEDFWEGVRRIHLPIRSDGAIGTIEFDMKSAADAMRRPGTLLTLGYNTGFLCTWLWMRGRTNFINMDGLEWKRAKYSFLPRVYLWINERLAAWSGDRLIADHPTIADHLATRAPRRRILTIPYGSDRVDESDADAGALTRLGLEPGRFLTVIARPEPENSILEIVTAFSARPRGVKLALLGQYDRAVPFQAAVLDAAGPEVIATGPIYDKAILAALRFHSLAYLHGHRVGGTNPSLVEALGAGNAIIAHDNPFNRWVAGDAALFFSDVTSCADAIERILADEPLRRRLSRAARQRWQEEFTWPDVLERYRAMLEGPAPAGGERRAARP